MTGYSQPHPGNWHMAVRPTPLHPRMAEASRTNQWSQRLGWTVPEMIDTHEAEHATLRTRCTLADRTPLATYRFNGPDTAACLNRLAGGCGGNVSVGGSRHVALCDDGGALVADGIVMRPDIATWLLTLPVRAFDWLSLAVEGFECAVEDVSDQIATLGVEGPASCATLLSAGFAGLEALRPGAVRILKIGQAQVVVARRSATAGLGYELRMAVDDAVFIFDRVRRDGAFWRPQPVGEATLRLTRLEAGLIHEGAEYTTALIADPDARRSPLELGLGALLDLSVTHFTGHSALTAQRQHGPERALIGLEIEGDIRPQTNMLMADNKTVGRLTSVEWSPACKRIIALADIDAGALGNARDLQVFAPGGPLLSARIVPRPFYRCETARRTPPDAQ